MNRRLRAQANSAVDRGESRRSKKWAQALTGLIRGLAALMALNRPPRQTSASTRYTVQSQNRDQFLRIVAVHHSGRTPTVVDAKHDYHVDLDAMQS